jgi:amino-acid N-acetyltransferase
MIINNQVKIIKAGNDQRQAIIDLLQSEQLPVEDLLIPLDDFFVAIENNIVIGAIGLEQYKHYGLLRSMVVDTSHRNKNIASQLILQLESYAITAGINYMYLLTETAQQYFERKGYQKIAREEVPEVLQASSEFSHVCPASAIIMKKKIS